MQKKKAFLKDPKLNMSAEEKNKRLSAKLGKCPSSPSLKQELRLVAGA